MRKSIELNFDEATEADRSKYEWKGHKRFYLLDICILVTAIAVSCFYCAYPSGKALNAATVWSIIKGIFTAGR